MSAEASILAHQGGWDEILMVAVPLAIFAALLWLANRRADAEVARRSPAAEEPDASAPAQGPDPGQDPDPD